MAQLQADFGPSIRVADCLMGALELAGPLLKSYLGTPMNPSLAGQSVLRVRSSGARDEVILHVSRKGTRLAPFAGGRWPMKVYTVTSLPLLPVLNQRAPRLMDTDWPLYAYLNVLEPVQDLVRAMCHFTSAGAHHQRPTFYNVFLSTDGRYRLPSGGIVRSIWDEHMLLDRITGHEGEDQIALIFTPAHADPYQSPMRWAGMLSEINGQCVIGYAFR